MSIETIDKVIDLWGVEATVRVSSEVAEYDFKYVEPELVKEIIDRVDTGELYIFDVEISIIINGVNLGTECLSGYFIDNSGYYEQMVDTAISYARCNIESFQEILLPPQ